jgi:hypothetical protein
MTDKLDNGDTNARKGCIRSIIDAVEVDEKAIRIIGSRDVLQAVIAANRTRTEMFVVLYANGAPEEIRTPDPQIRSLVLYPAELRARFSLGLGLTARVHPRTYSEGRERAL